MGGISDQANTTYRDFVVDGSPSSGRNPPAKNDIRALFATIDSTVNTIESLASVNLNTSSAHSVHLATLTALPANVYNNGTAGVGATLTAVNPGALTIDGKPLKLNRRVLVKNEATTANNGIYLCTQAGAVSVPYILTRAVDADTPAELDTISVFVSGGSSTGGLVATTWSQPLVAAGITIGTTAMSFSQDAAPPSNVVTSVSARVGDVTAAQLLGDIFDGGVISENTVTAASTTVISALTSPKVLINGTTTITAFTAQIHSLYFIRFAASLLLTYNATSLILPGAANIITQAGDTAIMTTDGSGNCRIRHYQRGAVAPDAYGRENFISNSAFDVWQDGPGPFTPNASVKTYLADMWFGMRPGGTNSTSSFSRQAGFNGAQYCLRIGRVAANAQTALIRVFHQIPTDRATQLAGKQVSLSFDVLGGADFGAVAVSVRLYSAGGVDEAFDLSALTFVASTTLTQFASVTPGSATRYVSPPVTVPSDCTECGVEIQYVPVGTAGSNEYFEIANVKLEIGPNATPYEKPSKAVELGKCLRYYQKSFNQDTAPAQNVGTLTGENIFTCTIAGASNNLGNTVRLYSPMRAQPTVTFYNPVAANGHVRNTTRSTDSTAESQNGGTSDSCFTPACTGVSGWVVGDLLCFHWKADARL